MWCRSHSYCGEVEQKQKLGKTGYCTICWLWTLDFPFRSYKLDLSQQHRHQTFKNQSVVWYAEFGYCFTQWELICKWLCPPVYDTHRLSCLWWYGMPHTLCRPALFVSRISRYTSLVMYASSLLFTFILISKSDKTPLEERFILTLLEIVSCCLRTVWSEWVRLIERSSTKLLYSLTLLQAIVSSFSVLLRCESLQGLVGCTWLEQLWIEGR